MRKWLVTLMIASLLSMFVLALGYNLVDSAMVKNIPTTSLSGVIQDVMPSVVHIMCDRWQGSGVALTENIVVTARHVVDGTDYTITLNNGIQVKGVKAISHKNYDVGFIMVNESILKPAKFGSIKECVLGQPVFIIGSPFGKINFNSVSLGIISGLNRNWDGINPWTGDKYGWEIAFTSDSAAHPGNSGGPVFSMDGVVRGLLVGGYSPVLNCSMPSDLFMDDVELIKTLFALDKYKVEKEKPIQINMEY
jgi:S1-C subfamily serine protease